MEGGPAGCPQVFVVDSQAPVTLSPSHVRRDSFRKKKEYLLYLLVAMALLGVIIEAGFIYHLYNSPATAQVSLDRNQNMGPEKLIGNDESDEFNEINPVQDKKTDYKKPAAFLQGKTVGEDGVMQYQTGGLGSFLHEVGYENGNLKIQKDGFYYIHSKVCFSETCSLFSHQIKWRTSRYGKPNRLMQAIRYSCVKVKSSDDTKNIENSFLGGVFRLYKNDSVFVQVNKSSSVKPGVQDNFFGLFMI